MRTSRSIFQIILALTFSLGAAQSASAAKLLDFSAEESSYLANRGAIKMCVDPDWMPYEKIDAQGKHIGIASEYMVLFATALGKRMELVRTENWAQSEEFARARKCDILSMLNRSPARLEFLNFTAPYVTVPMVFATKEDEDFIDSLASVNGKSLAIVTGYVHEDAMREAYPEIIYTPVKSVADGLQQVSDGKISTSIGSLFLVTYHAQKLGLTNIKISGHFGSPNNFRVGVRKDDPLLLSVFQKAVDNLDPIDENEITRRWMSIRLEHSTDYTLVFWVIGIAAFIVSLFAYRHFIVHAVMKKLNRSNVLLEEKTQELETLSRTDALTQIKNRLGLNEVLQNEVNRSIRYKAPVSCMMLDIDQFKPINDTHGHMIGDQVLRAIAGILASHVRVSDQLGRWGGEEFLIICPETNHDNAAQLAEKLRMEIESMELPNDIKVTCSFGVTEFLHDDTVDTFVNRADSALYDAKAAGRNKVVVV